MANKIDYKLYKLPLAQNIQKEYSGFIMQINDLSPFQEIDWGILKSQVFPHEEFAYLVLGYINSKIVVSAVIVERKINKFLSYIRCERGLVGNDLVDVDDFALFIKKSFPKAMSFEYFPNQSYAKLINTKTDSHKFPANSIYLDLTKTTEDLLKDMKQKTRYNIKKAQENHDLETKIGGIELLDDYLKLSKLTMERKSIMNQPERLFRGLFDLEDISTFLVLTYKGIIPISGGIFLINRKRCTYYVGASDYQYRELMAPYLVQWEAIRYAKHKKCNIYDFLGVSPENTKDHLSNVTRFKEGFGGIRVFEGNPKIFKYNCIKYLLFKVAKALKRN